MCKVCGTRFEFGESRFLVSGVGYAHDVCAGLPAFPKTPITPLVRLA